MTPTDEETIIARLKADAKAGNVQAARELREWLRAKQERGQAESIDTATSYAQLSAAQRLELRNRLMREALTSAGWREDVLLPSVVTQGAQEIVGAQAPVQAPE